MMKSSLPLSALLLGACLQVQAACTVRAAYPNTDTPPNYIGSGSAVPDPPGAGVELMKEIVAGGGCTVGTLTRLPPLRVRSSMEAGQVDVAPLNVLADAGTGVVFPTNKQGQADQERALRVYFVMFVRAADNIPKNTDPATLLAGRRIGLTHGSTLAPILRQSGVNVDNGAVDSTRNLDKLLRNRIDAFTVSLANIDDMDAVVAARFGNAIVRLDKPLRVSHVWLAVSKDFYAAHQAQVEAMWNWVGANASKRFGDLLKKYD